MRISQQMEEAGWSEKRKKWQRGGELEEEKEGRERVPMRREGWGRVLRRVLLGF